MHQQDTIEAQTRRAVLRESFAQAYASAGLEGYVLAQAYLDDCEAVIAGKMTLDELQARSLERAKALDQASRR